MSLFLGNALNYMGARGQNGTSLPSNRAECKQLENLLWGTQGLLGLSSQLFGKFEIESK